MNINSFTMQDVIGTAKKQKEEWVSDHPDETDIPTTYIPIRGDLQVLTGGSQGDPEMMMQIIFKMIVGFNLDQMILVVETISAKEKKNPVSGEDWEHGEMQYVLQQYPEAVEKGWLSECLQIFHWVKTDGDLKLDTASVEYQIKDGRVVWGDEVISNDETVTGGHIPEVVAHYFSKQEESYSNVEDALNKSGMGDVLRTILQMEFGALDEEQQAIADRAMFDIATIIGLAEYSDRAMFGLTMVRGEYRTEVLTKMLERMGIGYMEEEA